MDKTDCLDLPYPECDPPLVKDASDIAQFQSLALAVDAAVQTLDDRLTDRILTIPALNMSGGSADGATYVVHTFGAGTTINNGGMYDANKDLAVIQRDGWYALGGWVSASHASLPGTSCNLVVQPYVNNVPVSAPQGPGHPAVGAESVSWADTLFLRAGDEVQFWTFQSLSPIVVTYTVTMWIMLVIDNV